MPKFKNKSGGGPHNPPFKFGGMLAANRAFRNKAQVKAQPTKAQAHAKAKAQIAEGNVTKKSGGGGMHTAARAIGAGLVKNRPERRSSNVGMGIGALGANQGSRAMGMFGGMFGGRGSNRGMGGFSAFFQRKRGGYAK